MHTMCACNWKPPWLRSLALLIVITRDWLKLRMSALPPFSLAHLTVLDLPPPEVVSFAANFGYEYAGLRLLPPASGTRAYPLMDDAQLLRETLLRSADTGIAIFDVEIIRLEPGFEAASFLSVFEVAAKLGAKAVLVAGIDPNESRLSSTLRGVVFDISISGRNPCAAQEANLHEQGDARGRRPTLLPSRELTYAHRTACRFRPK
jgi:hypothetical protein